MAYCPNPECKHRLKTGKPAEFREGVTACTDCGTELIPDNPLAAPERVPCPRPLKIRLWITLGVAAALWLGFLIPPVLVNTELLEALFQRSGFNTPFLGPLAIGVTPWLGGFVLVEMIALLIPPWRRRRLSDPGFRIKLTRASLITGVAAATLNGLSMSMYLEGLNLYNWGGGYEWVVENPGWLFRIQMTLVFAAGSSLFLLAAHLINRFGLGSGFAVVILIEILSMLPGFVSDHCLALSRGLIEPIYWAVMVVALIGLFAGVRWFLLRRDPVTAALPLRLPTCGTLPLELAVGLTMLMSTAAMWIDWQFLRDFYEKLAPGTRFYLNTELILVALFVPLASAMFYWRHRKRFAQDSTRAAWRRARFLSGLFLFCVVGAWYALYRVVPEGVWLVPNSLLVLGATAIGIDLWQEIRARWRAPGGADLALVKSHQDLTDALEATAARGKGAFLQGQHVRTLAYFFGPFVPLAILDAPGIEQGKDGEHGNP
jgi:hypothetical protein